MSKKVRNRKSEDRSDKCDTSLAPAVNADHSLSSPCNVEDAIPASNDLVSFHAVRGLTARPLTTDLTVG